MPFSMSSLSLRVKFDCEKCNPADTGGGKILFPSPPFSSPLFLFPSLSLPKTQSSSYTMPPLRPYIDFDPLTGFNYRELHPLDFSRNAERQPPPPVPSRQLPRSYDPNKFPILETCGALWRSIGRGNVDFQLNDIPGKWYFEWQEATWIRLQDAMRSKPNSPATITAMCVYLRFQGKRVFDREIKTRKEFCSLDVSLITFSSRIALTRSSLTRCLMLRRPKVLP